MFALPAVDVAVNVVAPPAFPLIWAPSFVKAPLPAVALFVKFNVPPVAPPFSVTKFCGCPELLVIPVPLIVKLTPNSTVMV